MADQQAVLDVDEEGGAPAPPSSPGSADHPQYVTREDHEAAMVWAVSRFNELLDGHFRGTQSMLDKKLSEIAEQAGLSAREQQAILEEVGTEAVGEERVQSARERARAQAAADNAAAKEAARVKALEETVARQTAAEQGGRHDPEVDILWTAMEERLAEFGAEQGVDHASIYAKARKDLLAYPDGKLRIAGNSNYREGIREFERRVKAGIKGAADTRHAAEQPRVDMDTSGGGGGGGTPYDNYIKALREGKPLPSAAEIDRITAGRYA